MQRVLAVCLTLGAAAVRNIARNTTQTMIEGVPMINGGADIDDFIVVFDEGTTETSIAKFCDGHCPTSGRPDHGGVAWASIRGKSSLELLLKRRGDIKVQHLEPDDVGGIPDNEDNDLDELGVQSDPWNIQRVNAHNAPSQGRGAHIYMQDGGIRTTHREFGGRAISAIDMSSGRLVNCRGNPSCARDRHGHGTGTAGVAASRGYGVAKQARVYAVKTVRDTGGGQTSWQFTAMEWVRRNARRPAVLSISLTFSRSSTWERELRRVTEAGIVILTGAGNRGGDACLECPQFSRDVITVGATTSRNARRSSSNFGDCVAIFAPGAPIVTLRHDDDRLTTTRGGTSQACPHVSGAAALLLGRNPGLSVARVRRGLTDSNQAAINYISDIRGSADRFLWVGRRRVPRR